MTSKSYIKLTSITSIPPEILETHILSRLDASDLASSALVSSHFHAMCMNDNVWSSLCNSTWMSTKHPLVRDTISTFPGGRRSFFKDSCFILYHDDERQMFFCRRGSCTPVVQQQVSKLISAVDIHYKKEHVYSNVNVLSDVDKDTFLDSPFRVELLDEKETVRMSMKYEDDEDACLSDLKEHMTLSWILIDPKQKRAVNVSSMRPMTVRPHWVDGDVEVKYAVVVAGDCQAGMSELVELRITVMVGWKEGGELELRKVNLQVRDMDGNCLSGKGSLGLLHEIIKNGKRKKSNIGEERDRYRKYVNMKSDRREGRSRGRRSTLISTLATIIVVLVFFVVFCVFYIIL